MKRPLRIIVADDDRDAVAILVRVLRHVGHDVYGVSTGADVISEVGKFGPDAVILDLHMPGMDGFEVARRIARKGGAKPLLIAISGVYMDREDRFRAELAGFDHFILKPYEPSDVLKALSSCQPRS